MESRAADTWYMPEQLKLQFAGNIGLFSIGVGKIFMKNHLQTDLFYGHVPASIGGRDLNTIALKNSYTFHIHALRAPSSLASFYWGGTLLYTDEVDVKTLDDDFEGVSDDYPVNAIHLMPYIGVSLSQLKLGKEENNRSAIYFEAGMLDHDVDNYLSKRNYQRMFITEFINLSVGISFMI